MAWKCWWRHAFRFRGLLMVPPLVFVALSTQWEVENDALVFGLGGAVFVLGVLLRLWAQMHLRYRLRVTKVLTATGPYAFTRNPIYLGNCLIMTGMCFLCELFWFAPVMWGWCAVLYHFVVDHEEAHLIRKYGQPYRDYLTRVPRWLPRQLAKGDPLPEKTLRAFLVPSLLAEAHTLLFLVLPLVKEFLA